MAEWRQSVELVHQKLSGFESHVAHHNLCPHVAFEAGGVSYWS